ELKSGQIQQWRKERLRDAGRVARSPLLRQAVEEFLCGPGGQNGRADLRERLKLERMVDVYSDALLLAPDGKILLNTVEAPDPVGSATQQAIAAALASQEAALSDFYRGSNGAVHIDVAAVVRDLGGQLLAVVI